MKFRKIICLCLSLSFIFSTFAMAESTATSGNTTESPKISYQVIENNGLREVIIKINQDKAGTVQYKPQEQRGYQFSDFTVTDATGSPVLCVKGNDGYYTVPFSAGLNTITVFYVKTIRNIPPFTDVKSTDWFYDSVKYVYDKFIMNGITDTVFSSNEGISRGMFVTILYRIENEPICDVYYMIKDGQEYVYDSSKTYIYKDIDIDDYFATPIIWASKEKIVNGTGNNLFNPDANLTREQIAVILYRYMQATDNSLKIVSSKSVLDFNDGKTVSPYAKEAVNWAISAGLLQGSSGSLNPEAGVTRAQAAALIQRYMQGLN